ncbi:hypothetical protein OOK31_33525 [Streptomyces sp. NBC_00249]|uniref:hypothetical protein n=1 Tax=Streptomyces sp. NBC_00249 TaxID=2975690 RepID=UPI00225AA98B|nr:hypothetical protein [Streptomyces sp. NBC_00249]MCX5198750.1 hypothetical protein [Streptomyces sp. NBC_00249]
MPTLAEGSPGAAVTETATVTVGPTVTVTEKTTERITSVAKEGGGGRFELMLALAALITALSGATATASGIRKDRRRSRSRR